MKKIFSIILILLTTFSFINCGDDGDSGIFSETTIIAVDSENDRLFVIQPERELFILEASSISSIGELSLIHI